VAKQKHTLLMEKDCINVLSCLMTPAHVLAWMHVWDRCSTRAAGKQAAPV